MYIIFSDSDLEIELKEKLNILIKFNINYNECQLNYIKNTI